MKHTAAFSSARQDWETPQAFFDHWHGRYKFTLDAAASPDNAKCANYFTVDDDGLVQPWHGNVWCNPPYGDGIGKWVEKASREVEIGNAALVALLIPARTDTRWWHDYIMHADSVWLIKGRLSFGDGRGQAPFPSTLVIFRKPSYAPYRPMVMAWDPKAMLEVTG